MLQENGYLQVIDFGLSKVLADGAHTCTFAGSPLYLAPEVSIDQFPYTRQIDWWAVGIMAYEMLVGTHPFVDSNHNLNVRQLLKHLRIKQKRPIVWPTDV